MDTIDNNMDQFVDGINQLITGYLPPILVPQNRLKKIITDITRRLDIDSLDTSLVETRPNFYYMMGSVVSTHSIKMDKVFAMVSFPIRADGGGLMSMYRVENIPITLNSTSRVSTRVTNVPEFLAISVDQRFYSEYSAVEIATCTGEELLTCKSERSLRARSDPSCIKAIFDNDGQRVNETCEFAMEMRPRPSSATKIDADLYYLHSSRVSNSGENPNWNIRCRINRETTTSTIKACSGCTHRLPCGCSLDASGEFTSITCMPSRLCDASDSCRHAVSLISAYTKGDTPSISLSPMPCITIYIFQGKRCSQSNR